MSPSAIAPFPSDPHAWVRAEPFRAKARHLLAVAELPWPALAVAAGIPLSCLDHLLHGRDGRALRRVPRRVALRLLALDGDDLRAAARQLIPAAASARRLRGVVRQGADPRSLARFCDLSLAEFDALIGGRTPSCAAWIAWLAAVAEQRWLARHGAGAAA